MNVMHACSYTYCEDQTDLDAGEDDADVGGHADDEVEFVDVEEVDGGLVVDEAEHGGDDDGGEHHYRRVVEQRR